jgi:hypothetical protein
MSLVNQKFLTQIEAIESAYEFMLAYAAQGRDSDEKVAGGSEIERVLASLAAALTVLWYCLEYESARSWWTT